MIPASNLAERNLQLARALNISDFKAALEIISHGIDVNAIDYDSKESILYLILQHASFTEKQIITLLNAIENSQTIHASRPYLSSRTGETPFTITVNQSLPKLQKYVLSNPHFRNVEGSKTIDALIHLIDNKQFNLLERVVSIQNIAKYANQKNNYLLINAIQEQRLELAESLLLIEEVKETAHENNNKILCTAAEENTRFNVQIIKQLLTLENVRNHADCENNKLLFWAVDCNLVYIVNDLLTLPGVRNKAHLNDNQLLLWAIRNKHIKIAELVSKLPNVKNTIYYALHHLMTCPLSPEPAFALKVLPYCSLFNIPLLDLLDKTKKTSKELITFIADPIEYLIEQNRKRTAPLSTIQLEAFKLLYAYMEEVITERILREEQNLDNESSMDPRRVKAALKHFDENVKPQYEKALLSYSSTNNELEAVKSVMIKIKELLLKEMLEKDQESNDKEVTKFIHANREKLLNGDLQTNQQAIKHFNSPVIDAHTAFRGFIKECPHIGHPMLLVEQEDETNIFTNNTFSENVSLKKGANYVKYQVAMYFVANLDAQYQEGSQNRLSNFIGVLAELQRGNNKDKNRNTAPDRPTCFPGALGRIVNMGAMHPTVALNISSTEVIEDIVKQLILDKFQKIAKKHQNTKNGISKLVSLYHSLLMLDDRNASDVLSGKASNLEVQSEQERIKKEKSYLIIRKDFIKQLGTLNQIIQYINKELLKQKKQELTPDQFPTVKRCMLNVCFNSNWEILYNALPIEAKKVVNPDAFKSVKENHSAYKYLNPFALANNQNGQINATLFKRFKTFETYKELIDMNELQKDATHSIDSEEMEDFLKEFCQEFPSWELKTYPLQEEELTSLSIFIEELSKTIIFLQDRKIVEELMHIFTNQPKHLASNTVERLVYGYPPGTHPTKPVLMQKNHDNGIKTSGQINHQERGQFSRKQIEISKKQVPTNATYTSRKYTTDRI